MNKELVHHVEHFVVVLHNGHLQVEPSELAEVPVRVRVLSPKHWANLEDAVKVSVDRHLLVELRRLRQVGLRVEEKVQVE